MNPTDSWWFYAPFALFVILSFVALSRLEEKKDDTVIFLALFASVLWSFVSAARFLIYIIPFSNHVISSPYFAVPSILIGLILYRIRCKYPFFYGGTEVSVAVLAIFVSIGTDTANPLNKILGILGGVYIFIRGLDNMDKGLPQSWRTRWDRWFPKRFSSQLAAATDPKVEAQSPKPSSETPPAAPK